MKIMKRTKRTFFGAVTATFTSGSIASRGADTALADPYEMNLSDAGWRRRLSTEQYRVLRRGATEPPNASPLINERRNGSFFCAGCESPLFASSAKFDSGTGWPSFSMPIDGAVATRADATPGSLRHEVLCRRCGGHLGHVFDDGPNPTGLRYCLNGAALLFRQTES
ncbi:peptide-methionine (R)-S-oxide reductase MsrB [Caballeronia sp. TF1N1]|uniref:peptide-methionine (R)-S-oxide reductase MsrB n=1 Tax=Caballeronia sp. TF1N1 TaxID=2878153 RepID=UPI001FCFA998|nr:peptide-methionine (R)-S-oxide reductase MsrB [Caballeronia sp. TF1N1]